VDPSIRVAREIEEKVLDAGKEINFGPRRISRYLAILFAERVTACL